MTPCTERGLAKLDDPLGALLGRAASKNDEVKILANTMRSAKTLHS
jgi:hypothetical protein